MTDKVLDVLGKIQKLNEEKKKSGFKEVYAELPLISIEDVHKAIDKLEDWFIIKEAEGSYFVVVMKSVIAAWIRGDDSCE